MNQSSLIIQDDAQRIKNIDRSAYKSLPMMTKYEFNQIIGLRTMHLARGAIPLCGNKKHHRKEHEPKGNCPAGTKREQAPVHDQKAYAKRPGRVLERERS